MKFNYSVYVLVVGLLVTNCEALSDKHKAAIRSKLVSSGMTCIKAHPLSLSEIMAFRNKTVPDSEDAKCFLACFFKKVGLMDNTGMLSSARALEHAKSTFKDNDEHLKNVGDIMQKCSSVNEENTSDGKKGCDRAKVAFSCLAENAPKYGFDVNF